MYQLNCAALETCSGALPLHVQEQLAISLEEEKSSTHLALSAPFKWVAVTECQDRAEGRPEMLRDTDKEFFRLYFCFVTFQVLKNLGF